MKLNSTNNGSKKVDKEINDVTKDVIVHKKNSYNSFNIE